MVTSLSPKLAQQGGKHHLAAKNPNQPHWREQAERSSELSPDRSFPAPHLRPLSMAARSVPLLYSSGRQRLLPSAHSKHILSLLQNGPQINPMWSPWVPAEVALYVRPSRLTVALLSLLGGLLQWPSELNAALPLWTHCRPRNTASHNQSHEALKEVVPTEPASAPTQSSYICQESGP